MTVIRITFENNIKTRYSYIIEVDKEEQRELPIGKWKGRQYLFKGVKATTFIDYPRGNYINELVDEFLKSEYCPITFQDDPPVTFVTIERDE